jgi:hypothetical protein
MKIQYTFDDSAARLPLAIRGADSVWDRAAEIRQAPGVLLVELTTQHMLNTGASLTEELATYFDDGTPSENDPYALGDCYANREWLEDLLRDLRDAKLVAFAEVEALFPVTFMRELSLTLALTAVGFPAFGYVRTYKDSEGEEYHGMVVNLAQARPHMENQTGQFSLSRLVDMIRYGFFNHEGFQIAYHEFTHAIDRIPNRPLDRLKDTLLSRGIAWHLSYRHDFAFYDEMLGLDADHIASYVESWNTAVEIARKKGPGDEAGEDWLYRREATVHVDDLYIDWVGYHAARAIADKYGNKGLRDAVTKGPDQFITLYNEIGPHNLKG